MSGQQGLPGLGLLKMPIGHTSLHIEVTKNAMVKFV
jgi:hypothetical protein